MCLLETGVDSGLFLATIFDIQLFCCWIFYFFFNPVMFLPGIYFFTVVLFISSLNLGPPYYFLVFFLLNYILSLVLVFVVCLLL